MKKEQIILIGILSLAFNSYLVEALPVSELFPREEGDQKKAENAPNNQTNYNPLQDFAEPFSPNNTEHGIIAIPKSLMKQMFMKSFQRVLSNFVSLPQYDETMLVLIPEENSIDTTQAQRQDTNGSTDSITENPNPQLTTNKSIVDIINQENTIDDHLIAESSNDMVHTKCQEINDESSVQHTEVKGICPKCGTRNCELNSTTSAPPDANEEPAVDVHTSNTHQTDPSVLKLPSQHSESDTTSVDITSLVSNMSATDFTTSSPISFRNYDLKSVDELPETDTIPLSQQYTNIDELHSVSELSDPNVLNPVLDVPCINSSSKNSQPSIAASVSNSSKTTCPSQASKDAQAESSSSVTGAFNQPRNRIVDTFDEGKLLNKSNGETEFYEGMKIVEDVILGLFAQQIQTSFVNAFDKVAKVLRDMLDCIYSKCDIPSS